MPPTGLNRALLRSPLLVGATVLGVCLAGAPALAVDAPPVTADPPSVAAEATSSLPAPLNVRLARVTGTAVMLRWNEVPGATGYVVSRADTVDGEYVQVAETAGDVFATDGSVDTSTPRFYRVQARGADGITAPSPIAASSVFANPPALPDGVLTFDLGPGAVAPGATAISATTAYGAGTRAGFIDPSKVTATDRGTPDATRSDFVTIGDTELVVDLPNGDYTVGLIAGDATGPTDLALIAEQMTKVQPTTRTAGQYLEMSFDIAVVDGQLNLDVAGTAANLNGLTITRQADRAQAPEPTVWLTGDSTVQTYRSDVAPQAGWGQMIDRFLSDDIAVDNRAIGGRSSKNFISQGRLDEVLRGIKPGDYLFVQFGHNDNSYGVDDRFAAPADYYEYLRTYVDGAKQRGATPVLVTPVSRRAFGADGKAVVSFPAYVEAVQKLAAETGTPVVDLAASSRAYLDGIGAEAAKSVYLHVPAGVYPSRPTGTVDDTHFQEYGAIQMARLVAEDVAGLDIPLAGEVEEAEPPAAVPAAPTGVVAASVSNSTAQLTWGAVEGADIYRVFRKDAGAGEDAYALVATSTLPQAAVPGLAEGREYDVRVVAVNGRGESAPSSAVRIATKSPLYRFDVQQAGSPVMPGYTEVNQTSAYSAQRGWGFLNTAGLAGRDRGIAFTPPPTDLERDFLLPTPSHDFAVDVPNGSYAVKTYSGDWIGTSRSNVQLEGKDFGSANAGRAAVAQKTSEPVLVTDGQLNLVMTGTSSRLNGIEITPLQLAPSGLALKDLSIDGAGVAVSLTWQAPEGAAGYRVYRAAAGSTERAAIGDTKEAAFTDTSADVGLEYTYTVVALTAGGTESVASNALVLTTVDPDVPTAAVPTGLTLGAVNKNDVTINWTPSDGALFYQVYRAEPKADGSLGDPELIGRADGASFTDTGVLTTIEYTYAVTAVNAGGASERSSTITSPAATTLERQAERLDRAPVAVQGEGGTYIGWRMLGLDDDGIAFHVYRDGERITDEPVTTSTNLLDADGAAESVYRVSSVVDGVERWVTEDFTVWDQQYLDVPIEKPADAVTKDGQPYSYKASDASVGDVDGDGEYEVILKWDPTNSRDNSQAGYTGTVYIDAYKLDGTRLWRIDLGKNIRAGAHYTQFQVFDLDGNGKAEVTLKTADGTVDGAGTVIGDSAADYRNSSGYVLSGPEYLTVFDGATGAAIDTIDYVPARGDVGAWGDTYGNRVDRFLAGVAYLDGEKPSVIFSRGYYTRAVIAAFDFDGTDLTSRWTFDSDESGSQYRSQGNHEFSVADVDGDQKDEIVFGSMTIDDDGEALYTTGLGHGDALHVSDFDPTNPGLEVFAAHEDMGSSGSRGATYRDAATGEIIWSVPAARDTGRAAMADIDPNHAGAEGWAIGGDAAYNSPVGQLRSSAGELLSEKIPAANFVTWWDGDLLREITDNDYDAAAAAGVPTISKWNPETQASEELYRAGGTLSNNTTKANPALQADLFGDWREEIVTRTDDSSALRIATTVDVTDYRLRTLQSDPVYRLGVAWQNTAYNQPPHTSYFLGADMQAPVAPSITYTGEDSGPGELVNPEPSFIPNPARANELKESTRVDFGLAGEKFGRGSSEVTLENLEAEDWFYVYLNGTGLGWRQASDDGEVSVTTPSGTRPGDNRVIVFTGDGTLLGWEALKVTGP